MVKEEFYYDSRDRKSKLHTVRYSPDDAENVCCVLQIVHGMAEYVERYREFAEFLTDRGIVVTGADHMGHGKSVDKNGLYGYFCEQDPATVLVRDVHRLKKATQALYPNVPYLILSHSMGSFIARNYMFRYGTGINGVIIMGTGMPAMTTLNAAKVVTAIQKLIFGTSHVSKLVDKLVFGSYNKRIVNPATPSDWLSRDEERVHEYIMDPMCGFVFTINGFRTMFELITRLYNAQNLSRIPKNLPVFMLSGTDDPVGEYGKGVQAAYDSLVAAGLENMQLKMYEGARHELLNEINRKEVMLDIHSWIDHTILNPSES